jgi:hypothetical protein
MRKFIGEIKRNCWLVFTLIVSRQNRSDFIIFLLESSLSHIGINMVRLYKLLSLYTATSTINPSIVLTLPSTLTDIKRADHTIHKNRNETLTRCIEERKEHEENTITAFITTQMSH